MKMQIYYYLEKLLQKESEDTKGDSESVNRGTDNTIAKRKWRKGQTKIYKTLHRKL
jgi:hypothetical protein